MSPEPSPDAPALDRRRFLAATAGLAIVPGPPKPIDAEHRSRIFAFNQLPYRLVYHPGPFRPGSLVATWTLPIDEEGGGGHFRMERADVSKLADRDHPADLRPSAMRVYDLAATGPLLFREWAEPGNPRCGLCRVGCNIYTNEAGTTTCIVALPPPGPPPEDLAGFRTHFPMRHHEVETR